MKNKKQEIIKTEEINTDNLIEFGKGTYFYLDSNKLEEIITSPTSDQIVTDVEIKEIKNAEGTIISTETIRKSYNRGKELNLAQLSTLQLAIEIVLEDLESDVDMTLGFERALEGMSLAYKLAFNTLLKEGILVMVED